MIIPKTLRRKIYEHYLFLERQRKDLDQLTQDKRSFYIHLHTYKKKYKLLQNAFYDMIYKVLMFYMEEKYASEEEFTKKLRTYRKKFYLSKQVLDNKIIRTIRTIQILFHSIQFPKAVANPFTSFCARFIFRKEKYYEKYYKEEFRKWTSLRTNLLKLEDQVIQILETPLEEIKAAKQRNKKSYKQRKQN